MITGIDHIVISVKNIKKSTEFYSSFLGKPTITKTDSSWKLGQTRLFITSPYKKSARVFDKHNLGLNHIAFAASSKTELQKLKAKLDKAVIKHSGIQTDAYSGNEFIWFDDPDKVRLEFYYRSK